MQHSFQPMSIEYLDCNPFEKIGKEWMLIAAQKEGKVNAMTASWGGMGVLWNKNVVYIVVRESRYTKEFIDGSDMFSITFYEGHQKPMLKYMGAVSGRMENKIENARLTVAYEGDTPFFEEASMVFVCRKLFAQPMDAKCILDTDIVKANYASGDYHTLYVGEITQMLAR